jgi:hypothetical protein
LDVWEAIPTWETDLEAARHYAFRVLENICAPTGVIAAQPLGVVVVAPPEPSPQCVRIAKEEIMRFTRRQLVLAGAGALCTTALGFGPELPAQSSDDAAIAQAVEAFRNAMLTADRNQFEVLCADQLSYGHSAGRIQTKAQFIEGATSGRSAWKFINLTDQSNQVVGNAAIVRYILTGETESAGKTNSVKIGVLMV